MSREASQLPPRRRALQPQGPEELTDLPLSHLKEHSLAFLLELFNLSVAGVDIPAIWILKAGKPREHGRSYHPISLLCKAAKILERLLLPNIVASASSIVEAELKANLICSSLVRWADGKQLAIAPLKSSVTLFTSDTHQFWLNRKCKSETRWPHWTEPLKSWVSRWTPTSPWPSRPRLCRTSHERPPLHETLSWVELWLHYWNFGGHVQGNCAPHHELL